MKKLGLLLVMLISITAFSQDKNERATLEVDGVCNMCKERIEKACIKTKGVKSAVWNVKTHELNLIFDARKTDLKTIENNIAAVGHDTKNVIATDEAYNSVHDCCRYREESVVDDHKND
jgi:cation transport ATPase